MSAYRMHRRVFTSGAVGLAVGALASTRLGAVAQEATPEANDATPVVGLPEEFVSTRIRTLESAEERDAVNDRVQSEFVPEVEALDGFAGYLLGNVVDHPDQSLSLAAFDNESQLAGFEDAAGAFSGSVDDDVGVESTQEWEGALLLFTPGPASPGPEMTDGHVSLRLHTALPDTRPIEVVGLIAQGYVFATLGELPGFQAYFGFLTNDGFAELVVLDSEESAREEHEAASEWASENLAEFTEGEPKVVNAQLVYANLPVLFQRQGQHGVDPYALS